MIGGERCEDSNVEWARVKQFASVPTFDLHERRWRADEVMPPMVIPRTAVALCVGVGHVNAIRP